MKKIIINITLILLVSSLVFAYDDGDILTQQQVDNINLEQLTWRTINCQREGVRLVEGEVYLDYSCQTLTPVVAGESYLVDRRNYAFSFSLVDARVWVFIYGLEGAIAKVRADAIDDVLLTVEETKQTIEGFQTPEEEEQAGSWFDNWTPFG